MKAKTFKGVIKRQNEAEKQVERVEGFAEVFAESNLSRNQCLFLGAYLETGVIKWAADMVGLHESTIYQWRKPGSRSYSEEFIQHFEAARDLALYLFEDEATRRGVYGVEKGVYYKGEKVSTERVYSDNLLMFMMKAIAPEKYREYYEVKHTHSGQVDVVNRIAGLSDSEMRALAAIPIKAAKENEEAVDVTPNYTDGEFREVNDDE